MAAATGRNPMVSASCDPADVASDSLAEVLHFIGYTDVQRSLRAQRDAGSNAYSLGNTALSTDAFDRCMALCRTLEVTT